MSKPRKIGDLLKPGHSGFASLVAHARTNQRIDALLGVALVPELAAEIRTAGLERGVLKLVVSSAAIATRVKLDAPELMRTLQAGGAGRIDRIETLVAPLPRSPVKPKRRRELSRAARDALGRMQTLNKDRPGQK